MLRAWVAAGVVCLVLVPLSAQDRSGTPAPNQPTEESIGIDRFRETHSTLLEPRRTENAGTVTEQLLASRPGGQAAGSTKIPRRNFIDDYIFGKMEREGVPHAPEASDQEFLRRVTLDLTGRIPSAHDVREFLADTDPGKRKRQISKLVDSEAFVDKWAYFFQDTFRANGKMGRGMYLFHYWMRENLSSDRPYDEVVREIITASAKSNHVVAASNVIAREHVQGKPQPDDGDDMGMVHQLDTHDELSILYGKTFLGINASCISCHDGASHLEKVNVWLSTKTREEFFQNAAFMGKSRYLMYWEDGKPQSGEFLIDDGNPGYDTTGHSMVRTPRPGGSGEPAFLLTGERPGDGEEPREAMARMITAHPQFARATANLFWKQLMGNGIVEPFDEFDLARQDPNNLPEGWQLQPTHPQLLDALANDFRENGHSLKHLMRTICESSAYQLSARFPGEWKDAYTAYFARKFARMLSAEEIHDAIVLATGRPGDFKAENYGFAGGKVGMAMKLAGPSGEGDVKYFLATFGQSNRWNAPKAVAGSPLQPLLLMYSPVVSDRVLAEKDSRVQRLLDSYQDDERVVHELYLSTLSREPSADEREIAMAALAEDRTGGAQNLQWALINNAEFIFNY